MDPITTALLSAISSGLNNLVSEASKDAYKNARQAIIEKLGNAKAIHALETDPGSEKKRAQLAEELAAKDADKDPEINRLARQLIQTLQETEAGREAVSRYSIDAAGARLGVVGNGTHIEGGIHFHQHTPSQESKPLDIPQDFESVIKAYLKSAEALYENLPLVGFRTRLRVPIRIEEIYVPLRAMLDLRATGEACFADAEDAEDAEQKLGHAGESEDLALPRAFSKARDLDRRGIVILGDPGSGKTTHLKRLLLWCLRQGPDELSLPADIIPVFLPLRELTDLDQGLDAFIQNQLDKPHLGTPLGFGRQLVARGNLLFLLDGLDEVADPNQRARVARWIDAALTVHRSCWFVVTWPDTPMTRSGSGLSSAR